MKRLLIAIILFILLTFTQSDALLTKTNFVSGTVDSSNLLLNAETTADTFAVLLTNNASDPANALSVATLYASSCGNATSCATKEIVKISAVSCTGTHPTRICTLTVSARNQESTTHSTDWGTGTKVAFDLTAGTLDEMGVITVTSGNFCKGTGTAVSCTDSATYAPNAFTQTGTGAVARTVDTKLKEIVSVLDFGLVADAVVLLDGSATASDATFTSATANFTAADIGKTIIIHGAGATYSNLQTTIASINSGTSVELTAAPSSTIAATEFVYGTNNTTAMQAYIDNNVTQNNYDGFVFKASPHREIIFPAGKSFVFATGIVLTHKDNITFSGGGNLYFNDIRLFSVQSSRRVTFDNLTMDGFQYNQINATPTYSTAIYIDDDSPHVLETRQRTTIIQNCYITRVKYGVYNAYGVEMIVKNNKMKAYHVKDSVGVYIVGSDNELTGNVINGFNKSVQQEGAGVVATGNHFYCNFGMVDTPKVGDTHTGSATIDGITETTYLNVGNYYTVSAGMPSASTYYRLVSKTANSITLDTNANGNANDATIEEYPTDVLYESNGRGTSLIGNELDTARNCMVRLKPQSALDTVITSNMFGVGIYTAASTYGICFEPANGSTGVKNVVVKDNTFYGSGTQTAFYFSANVDHTSDTGFYAYDNTYNGMIGLYTKSMDVPLLAGTLGGQKIIGGTAAGDGLDFQTTTGTGSGDDFNFLGGTNGATTIATINSKGIGLFTSPAVYDVGQADRRWLSIKGGANSATGTATLEFVNAYTTQPATLGNIQFTSTNNTTASNQRIVLLNGGEDGSTATNYGGKFEIYTKADAGALTARLTINNAGAVSLPSLASAAGSNHICFGTGGLLTYQASATACAASALKYKNIITSYAHGLDVITKINPQIYEYKKESASYDGLKHIGLIADELPAYMQTFDRDGQINNYEDRAVIATLVNAIKELNARIEKLESQCKLAE